MTDRTSEGGGAVVPQGLPVLGEHPEFVLDGGELLGVALGAEPGEGALDVADAAVDGAEPDGDELVAGVGLVDGLGEDRLDGEFGDEGADGVVGRGLADGVEVVGGGSGGAAGVLDALADGRVGRGGELVDAVGVEGRGDELGALEGELEEFTLGAVRGAAQVERGAFGSLLVQAVSRAPAETAAPPRRRCLRLVSGMAVDPFRGGGRCCGCAVRCRCRGPCGAGPGRRRR